MTSVEARSESSVSVYVSTNCVPLEGEGFGGESMEIDEESGRFPESCFVRRLIRVSGEELWNEGFDRKSIVAAVHCVLLESGFVRFDSVSGKEIDDALRLPSSMAFSVCLNYTLPAFLEKNERDSVVLKFQSLKHFVNVFASLNNGGSGSAVYRLCLDERRFAPAIGSLRGGSVGNDSEKELQELWKIVRDGLALPLMIDLCARAGLPGPACFSRLPAELLTKILELLPGNELARAGCVCKELSYLTSNNSLWMLKFSEEIGSDNMRRRSLSSWKSAFVEYRLRQRWEEEERAVWRWEVDEQAVRMWVVQRREEVEQALRRWEDKRAVRVSLPLYAPMFGFPPPLALPRIGGICGCHNQMPGLILPPLGPHDQNGYLPSWGPFPPH